MLRLMINLWILLGFIGSALLAMMVFAFLLEIFKEMMRKLK